MTNLSKVFRKSVDVTPLQEKLLDFFSDSLEAPTRIKALEWVYERALFRGNTHIEVENMADLEDVHNVLEIVRGIEAGY